jgi:hypothetical protein
MLFVVHTIRFGIYLRPDRGRHFLKFARYRWRAPSWMARLVLHLGVEGAPPSATAAPQRRLARARTGSWPGPPSAQTSPRWRPGRPGSGPPGRPRPCAAPSAAGRRPAADSRRGTPGRRGCGPARPGPPAKAAGEEQWLSRRVRSSASCAPRAGEAGEAGRGAGAEPAGDQRSEAGRTPNKDAVRLLAETLQTAMRDT